jgi:signal peptidase I
MEPVRPRRSKLYYLRYLLYLIPVLLLISGYGLLIVVTGESYPFTIVTGTSMQPTILPGSVALIDKVPFKDLHIGNIIVFVPQLAYLQNCQSSPGSSLTSETLTPCYVIHRIVSINFNANGDRIVTTRGDNNGYSIPTIDTDINSSMYVGKVILQFPLAGYVTEAPYNEYIAAVILFALVVELFFDRKQSTAKKTQGISSPQPSQVA